MNTRVGSIVGAKNVNFSVQAGEMRCMIGPNGAGKSSPLAMPCGILPVESGLILLLGADVVNRYPFERVRLGAGLTLQTNRVFHGLSVRENPEILKASADQRNRETGVGHYSIQCRLARTSNCASIVTACSHGGFRVSETVAYWTGLRGIVSVSRG